MNLVGRNTSRLLLYPSMLRHVTLGKVGDSGRLAYTLSLFAWVSALVHVGGPLAGDCASLFDSQGAIGANYRSPCLFVKVAVLKNEDAPTGGPHAKAEARDLRVP
jgi:hypothetical protein